MVYQWKKGSRIKADANAAGQQFEALSETVGLTAETVVDANRPADAVLHDEFEWDDPTAAEEWRKQQARHLMNCICIAARTGSDGEQQQEMTVRAFFNVEESTYEHIGVIFADEDKHAKLLASAKRELETFRSKYKTLKELAPVLAAIDEVIA